MDCCTIMTTNPSFQPDDLDVKLDALLAEWFQWKRSYRLAPGWGSASATTRDHRSAGHWDWWNGAADDRADYLRIKGFDEAMDRVPNTPHRWRTALEFQAMNLSSGASVWRSPVLPQDREELDLLLLEGRVKLLGELRKAGML